MNILSNKIFQACAGGAGLITGVLWYHGRFQNVTITEQRYGPYNYIYWSRVGDYEKLGGDWEKLIQEMNTDFKSSHAVGIYYDNPKYLEDPKDGRVAMGFVVNDNEKSKIESFLKKNPKYKQTTLPEVKTLSTSFPYKSFLSYKIIKDKIYPSISQHSMEKKIGPFCIVESYLFQLKNKKIDYNVPIGEGSKSYNLM